MLKIFESQNIYRSSLYQSSSMEGLSITERKVSTGQAKAKQNRDQRQAGVTEL